jgi:hypothetical protein
MKPAATILREKASAEETAHQLSVLLVGSIPSLGKHRSIRIVAPDEALETLRVLQFNLVLIATDKPDGAIWEFTAALRRFWPWQRWALVAGNLTEDDQRRAYGLGACAMFDSLPPPDELRRIAQVRASKIRFQPDTT